MVSKREVAPSQKRLSSTASNGPTHHTMHASNNTSSSLQTQVSPRVATSFLNRLFIDCSLRYSGVRMMSVVLGR